MALSDNVEIEKIPFVDERNGHTKYITFVEQFVKEVRDFSSQYGSNISISYTAYNITGKPSKFPDYGDYPQSFVMRTYGNWWDEAPSRSVDYMCQNNELIYTHDFIEIEYHEDVYPIRVSIYETYNPGSVVKIWARDCFGIWYLLWSGLPQKQPHKSRVFSPPLELCKFKTKILRLEFNHSLLDYYTEIDAVLLIGVKELILPRDNIENMSTLLRLLGDTHSNSDVYNLTPDISKIYNDLKYLKRDLHKYCNLHERASADKVPVGILLSKIEENCYSIPPIEEAFKNFRKFLEDDFTKLINDINTPSSLAYRRPSMNYNLVNKCDNNGTCGSFSVLPDEMVLNILSKLDIKSLTRVCRVNKYFNAISQDALLYTSLNLKPYWHCINASALRIFLSRCQYLQKLDLSWCDSLKSQHVVEYFTCCGHYLTNLRLNCCHFVDDYVIGKISSTCKYLKELGLRNCRSITNGGFSKLSNLNNLERLELYRTPIETPELCKILKNNPHMRHLNLGGMHDRLNMDEVADVISNFCLYLESIDFWKAQTLTPAGIRALSRCTRLREIDFGWCSGINAIGDSLRIFFISCTCLEKVFLAAIRGLSDRDIEPLLLCQQLQQLDLLGARALTPEICIRFLLCCPKLKVMDISFCDAISDVKVQEWRQLYPHVSIKRSFQVNNFYDHDV